MAEWLVRNEDRKVRLFISTTWHNINRRTVNGNYPTPQFYAAGKFLERGTRLEFTREEFTAWCLRRRDTLLRMFTATDKPSIDRIDPDGHYNLSNIRLMPFRENSAQGGPIKRARNMAKLPLRNCLACLKPLLRKDTPNGKGETLANFKRRLTCGRRCRGHAKAKGLCG